MHSETGPSPGPKKTGLKAIPAGIWALGVVSMFMDVSSEVIHSLLPVFLVNVLGASALSLGFIEGLSEATASIAKVFSGGLSDWLGRRKGLAAIGYGLAALTKPMFPMAGSVAWVFVARFLDRLGKGIRGAPRDALIADIAPPEVRGACYGLRQSLDTVGAFAGPLLAIGLMVLLQNDIRAVFWAAVAPAFVAVAILLLAVKEPAGPRESETARAPIRLAELVRFGRPYWLLVAVAMVLSLARFSEAFLVLRANNVGLSLALTPLVLVVMSAAYAVSAYPAGLLSDRIGRYGLVGGGLAALIAADALMAFGATLWPVLAGIALWGLHMGLTQGVLAAMVADRVMPGQRGTAFGVFNLLTGFATLAASILAGWLWDRYGPPGTFLAGMALATLALAGLAAACGPPTSRS